MCSFTARSYRLQSNISQYTVTSVSTAFRWAMLCTKSELRFRQSSLNHRTRNLRNIGNLQLLPYPLYRYAIVLLVFPLKVSRLFPLYSSNNALLRREYICAFNSALPQAYYRLLDQHCHCVSSQLSCRDFLSSCAVSCSVPQQHQLFLIRDAED